MKQQRKTITSSCTFSLILLLLANNLHSKDGLVSASHNNHHDNSLLHGTNNNNFLVERPISATDAVNSWFHNVFPHRRRRRTTSSSSADSNSNNRRRTEDYYAYSNDDDGNGNNNGDDSTDDNYVVIQTNNKENEKCSQFLVSFLEGTTDAKDTCEGIMNAYTSASCAGGDFDYDFDFDDYYENFHEHSCCQALLTHHSDYCEDEYLFSNMHLLVAGLVLLACECAKIFVKKCNINFLPEASICILVGFICGFAAHVLFRLNIDELSFDDELFMCVLLPPIIFEAALSVSKKEFRRRRGAIVMFAIFGTMISTFSTGLMVHYGSALVSSTTFPMLDSLTFGALISSIDPVAILSVLTGLGLTQTDTVFILVFGESLLNDGISITVFKTLVERFDGKTNDGSTSMDEILSAVADFLISMIGSIIVGILCGIGAWAYFRILAHNLHPVMEVASFFIWALVPYYICEGIEWSGIVSIVVMGFIMDIYIAAPKKDRMSSDGSTSSSHSGVDHEPAQMSYKQMTEGPPPIRATMSMDSIQSVSPLPRTERIRLSLEADVHVRFVAHLTAQLAENAIFAYIGLFLFSSNYNWDPKLISIAVVSCILSRALMVVSVCYIVYHIYLCRGQAPASSEESIVSDPAVISKRGKIRISKTAKAIQDKRTQAVLVIAGLRGAVSLALVENVPIYNAVTGEGCEYKPLMKGMTAGAILFTTFVFGGGAYYVLPHLGIQKSNNNSPSTSSDDENGYKSYEAATNSNKNGAPQTPMSGNNTSTSPYSKPIKVPELV